MANPQLEDGYTRIANELLEALISFKCNPSVKDFVFCIIRETYGYQEKEREISIERIAELLNVSHRRAYKIRSIAVQSGIIFHSKNRYSIQKDYSLWKHIKSDISEQRGSHEIEQRGSQTTVNNGVHKTCEQRYSQISEQRGSQPSIYKEKEINIKENPPTIPPFASEENHSSAKHGDSPQRLLFNGETPTPKTAAKKQRKSKDEWITPTTKPEDETQPNKAIRYAFETLFGEPYKYKKLNFTSLHNTIATCGTESVYAWVNDIKTLSIPDGADKWKFFVMSFNSSVKYYSLRKKQHTYNNQNLPMEVDESIIPVTREDGTIIRTWLGETE